MINYDSKFLTAVNRVLRHEGGYVNDPDDPGGATNFGVSLRWASKLHPGMADFIDLDTDGNGIITADEIKTMTRDEAIAIYHDYWWIAPSNNYNQINNDLLAGKVFDISVNVGNLVANKRLQICAQVTPIDGIIGPKSLKVINSQDPSNLLNLFVATMLKFYESIPNGSKYLQGWINRLKDFS